MGKITQGHAKVLVGMENANLLAKKIVEKKIISKASRKFSKFI